MEADQQPGIHAAEPITQSEMPAPLQTLSQRVPRLRWFIHFGWRLNERWNQNQCSLIAAAMAFFGLLSVFPLVLAVVAILSRTVFGDEEVLSQFQSYVASFFPGAAGEILGELRAIAAAANSTTLGVVAIVSLLWSGRAYFDTLAAVLNSIWPKARPRTFLQHQLALWSTFLGAGVLWLLSTGVTFALSVARALSDALPDMFINRQPGMWDFLARLTAWLLTALMFWLIYRFLPNAQPGGRNRTALGAALIAAIGWEIAKIIFIKFLGNVARYQSTYGSVAGVVMTMMWIYFASLIILLGAEAAAAYEETCAALPRECPKNEASAEASSTPGRRKHEDEATSRV